MGRNKDDYDWEHIDDYIDISNITDTDMLEYRLMQKFPDKVGHEHFKVREAIRKRWKEREAVKAEMEQKKIKDISTRRGNWMSMKEDVKATGTPATLKENDKYQVRVVRHGKGTRTMVINKNTGVALRQGSKREREALLGLI